MITVNAIKQGIAQSIASVFSDLPITDDPQRHVAGASFFVKMVRYEPSVFHKTQARRNYQFDIVYFAPTDTPRHTVDAVGQCIAERFMYPIKFGGRSIYAKNVYTRLVDDDFHVLFALEFFDEIKDEHTYKVAQSLEFSFELNQKE